MCNCNQDQIIDERFIELNKFIDDNDLKDEASLILVLHHAQDSFGYLPRNVQIHIATKMKISLSKIYGVVSFYSYFKEEPRGKNVIQVCIGTGCFVKGSDKVLETFENELNIKVNESSADLEFTLEGVRCIGACGLAPVVLINEKVYSHVQASDVKEILENYLIAAN